LTIAAMAGDVTADHAANVKTAHPIKTNKKGRIKFRLFFGPRTGLRFPGLFPPEAAGACVFAGWLYMGHLFKITDKEAGSAFDEIINKKPPFSPLNFHRDAYFRPIE
jgi:hypothetical protein